MPRVQPRQLEEKQRVEFLDILWTSIAMLKSRNEVKAFFKDLLSESEAIMLARRIKIAQRLLQGVEYDDIQDELHVGRSTIAGVHQWLTSGFNGYEAAIKTLADSAGHGLKSVKIKKARLRGATGKKARNSAKPFSLLNLLGVRDK